MCTLCTWLLDSAKTITTFTKILDSQIVDTWKTLEPQQLPKEHDNKRRLACVPACPGVCLQGCPGPLYQVTGTYGRRAMGTWDRRLS